MYVDFYGFREHPFLMTPDARLFYPSSGHAHAYAHLTYGLAQREGFIVITGEVGAGKTTLIEKLCAQLDPATYAVARIATTQVGGDDLLRLVAHAFGVPSEGTKAALLQGIGATLRSSDVGGRRHLLIVDEAQALPLPAMEELRMLSNITDGGRALLQTILMGQPQLRRIIASPDLDQLRQRVLASYHLGGLSAEETHAYIEHRMRTVGWEGRPTWEDGTFDVIHRHSGGIPRRINRLCSRVLLSGALEQSDVLTLPMVQATAQELEEDLSSGADSAPPAPRGEGWDGRYGSGGGSSPYVEQVVRDLAARLDALERETARRERVFNRLMDLFSERAGRL
ncbi:AAA family ATPase [Roseomonas sp. CCTCC AB2023176]|uniref:AAA family ATPase n=1 Tax=Roseomonas sp. CCTCC AB2023176 TaxID=3342640 RepID=UPI0035E350E9